MPTYQYTCRNCEQGFEKRLPMARSGDQQACPDCGSLDTRKSIGAIAVNSGSSATALRAERPPTSPFS